MSLQPNALLTPLHISVLLATLRATPLLAAPEEKEEADEDDEGEDTDDDEDEEDDEDEDEDED